MLDRAATREMHRLYPDYRLVLASLAVLLPFLFLSSIFTLYVNFNFSPSEYGQISGRSLRYCPILSMQDTPRSSSVLLRSAIACTCLVEQAQGDPKVP